MVNSADFAERLEKIMEYYGLTATALAEEMDFNRSTISHLVSGRNKPSLEFVMKILEKFSEVELDWLVLGKGVFPSTEDIDRNRKISKPKNPIEPQDLFSENMIAKPKYIEQSTDGNKIDRIVVFYENGTFKNYEN